VRSMLGEQGPLPPGRVAEIVSQVASALDAAHGRGLVHRDVKPANMLLDTRPGLGRPDHVYLSDFGLSKGSLQATGLTGSGMFLGTLDYIAPEQIEGRPVDGRADEYSLACAAFELIAGAPPFQRDDARAVMYAQLTEPAPSVTSRRPELPAAVDEVFAKALAKPAGERYQSCTEFAEALREALGIRPYDTGPGSIPGLPHPRTQVVGAVTGAEATAPVGKQGVTQIAPGRDTSPDRTAERWQPDDGGYRRRSWYRSPATIAAAFLLVIILAGGGSYLALHHKSKHDKRGGVIPPLAVPGCTTNAASAGTLNLPSSYTTVQGGNPFSVQVTRSGKVVFAITPTTLNVLVRGSGLTLAPSHFYDVASNSMAMNGNVLTNDEKYLLVAAGTGIDIFNVADAEAGISPLAGMLTVPGIRGNAGAVEVVLSPDNQFAFVTVKARDELAVFNLRKALADNAFGSSTFIGKVRLGSNPVGMTLSPDGTLLYVTSYSTTDAIVTGEGLLSVLDVSKAETDTAASVVAQTTAGCGPARVITSDGGKTVWVTARNSNALLGFNASLLLSAPRHSLIGEVPVGHAPIALTLVNGETRMIVSDTDTQNTGPTAHNLAVVNVAAALARKPALLGFIPTGKYPRDFATIPGGRYLLVADNGSGQVHVLDLSKLH